MAAFAWNVPAATDQALSANFADDHLAAINAVVTANEGGSGAFWEVKSYQSTSPRYVVLGRKDGAPGRLIFFGQQGSTPNAAAVSGSPTASVMYNGFAPTSVSDTPTTSWLSGAPFSDSDYMPGFRSSAQAGSTMRANYAESSDCFYLLLSSVSHGITVTGGGKLVEDMDGNLLDAVQGSGSSGSTAWATAVSASGSIFPAQVASTYTSTDAGLMVRANGVNQFAYRGIALASGVAAKLRNDANLRAHFHQIPLVYNNLDTTLTVLGKVRQVAFGPNCNRETFYSSGGVNAYGHQASVDAVPSNPGIWFIDIEV